MVDLAWTALLISFTAAALVITVKAI